MSEPTPEPFTPQPQTISSDPETRRRRRSNRDSIAQSEHKTKRRSTSSDQGGQYSSSSESHGGMADTETNEKREQPVVSSSSAPQEPMKKKRTRTLTTPHQSRVLHALLAQSRFPSTAQREEVGRSIGLSARKVQIWFQNQRQKARRPKNPNAGSAAASAGSSANLRSVDSSLAGRTPSRPGPDSAVPTAQSHLRASELPFDSAESRRYLSGPGVPGPGLDVPLMAYRGPHEVGARRHPRTIDAFQRTHPYPLHERYQSLSPTVPFQSHASATSRTHHMSRTLPPLIPSSSDHLGRVISRSSSFESSDPLPMPSRSISVSHRSHAFQIEPYTFAPHPIRPLSVPLRPEWESSPHSPAQSSSSLLPDTHDATAVSLLLEVRGETTAASSGDRAPYQHLDEPISLSRRAGRYDPVRGVVVPYPATMPTPSSPNHPEREDK